MTQHIGEPNLHELGRASAPSTHEEHDKRPRWPRKKRIAIALGCLLLAVAGLGILILGRDDRADTQVASDVPRREGDAIVVSQAFLERARIVTTKAVAMPLTPIIQAIGEVAFDPKHVAAVGTRAPGIVTRVLRVEGDVVDEGDVLAEIESTSLVQAQADLRIAEAQQKAAALDARRERNLLERQLTTAKESEQANARLAKERALANAARQRVEALGGARAPGVSVLRAPVSGLLAERHIAPGQNVAASLVAFRVGNLDELWVLLRVFDRHVNLIRVGDTVEVRTASSQSRQSSQGRVYRGRVGHVGSVIDEATRTADVRVELANEDRTLRPGQSVRAALHASGPSHVSLAVPSSSITYVDGSPTVFIAQAPTRFVARKVTLGLDGGERVEVVKGIREGDEVVSESALALKSELFR